MNDEIERLQAEIDKILEERPHLKGLQWKCDAIRQKYPNDPYKAADEIMGLMWESFTKLNKTLNEGTEDDE